MNKELVFRIINSKDSMYDLCENMEQLYDNFYQPLLIEYENMSEKYITQLNTIRELKRNQNNVLQQENKQLKDNWNTLWQYILEKDNRGYEKVYTEDILNKMQELERGSDSNVKK